MKLKITFENSKSNLKFLENDVTMICEVNAYVEAASQRNWDLRPPLMPGAFLKDVQRIENLNFYQNKQNNCIGVCADLDLLDEGMCRCEFTVSEVEEVNDFPQFKK